MGQDIGHGASLQLAPDERLLKASPSRLDFLAATTLQEEGSNPFFRTVDHEKFRKLRQGMPEAICHLHLTRLHFLASSCIQSRDAHFAQSDNRYFPCFAYDFLYDECSHRQRSRTRAIL